MQHAIFEGATRASYADCMVYYEGRWLGEETFVSFDRKAVAAMPKMGM